MPNRFEKSANETLDYTFDWSAWLQTGESISSQSVTVEDGLTKDSVVASSDAVTVWVSGGTPEDRYEVSCQITTDNSPARTGERSIKIDCVDR